MKKRFSGIKAKFIRYGFRIFTPVFFLLALVICIYSFKIRMGDMEKRSTSNTRSVATSLTLIQEDIKKLTTYISINTDIRSILENQDIESLNKNPRLWYENAPMETLQNLIALNGEIKTFALYPENGVRPFLRGMDGSVNHEDISRIRTEKEYSFTQKKEFSMYWCPVQKNTRGTFEVNRTDKIVFYRELFDLKNHDPLCFIAIGIDSTTFEDVCRTASGDIKNAWIVFNSDGELLSQTGSIPDKLKIHIQRNVINLFTEDKDLINFTFGMHYVTCCKSASGSIVCSVTPLWSFILFIIEIVVVFILSIIAILFTLYVLLLLMSRFIVTPLLDLVSKIKNFAQGDFNSQVEVTSDDEIGEVARAFNKMVYDINTLINENYVIKMKEKENELATLQAQINPHFLYNTLNSLYWQALNQNNEFLADNIYSLSRLFQLVLSQGRQEILVENEFELISCYLEVQKMRFDSKLNYEISLDPKIKKKPFYKLLLQPFVENSIEHGFSNKTSECNLFIGGKKSGSNMVFEIKDSGVGMTKKEIEQLFSGEKKVGHDRVGGYAIKNIIDRIHLLYGEDGIIKIESVLGEGTVVRITVPLSNKSIA